MLLKIRRAAVIGFCCLTLSAVSLTAMSASVPLDKVVAIVNNSVITQNQLDDTIAALKQRLQGTGQPILSPVELRKKALNEAIGEMLQLQVAQRAGIQVSDADVNQAMARVAQQNNLNVVQLKQALEKQGINYAHYRAKIHDQMLMQQVQQQALAGKVHVTAADVKTYLQKAPGPNNDQAQYHLDDLLIPLAESATAAEVDAATQQANALLQQARAGSSLTDLAKDNLQHTDLQWRTLKDLPSVFTGVVANLTVGEVTGPVRAPNGLHILRLLEAGGQTKPLTTEQARQMVLQQKVQEQADKWVMELRKTAYIKVM